MSRFSNWRRESMRNEESQLIDNPDDPRERRRRWGGPARGARVEVRVEYYIPRVIMIPLCLVVEKDKIFENALCEIALSKKSEKMYGFRNVAKRSKFAGSRPLSLIGSVYWASQRWSSSPPPYCRYGRPTCSLENIGTRVKSRLSPFHTISRFVWPTRQRVGWREAVLILIVFVIIPWHLPAFGS